MRKSIASIVSATILSTSAFAQDIGSDVNLDAISTNNYSNISNQFSQEEVYCSQSIESPIDSGDLDMSCTLTPKRLKAIGIYSSFIGALFGYCVYSRNKRIKK